MTSLRNWFARAPIRRKLAFVIATTMTAALLLAASALGGYELTTSRRELVEKTTVTADIVGRNTTAALTFGDRSVAADLLGALEAEPTIEAGAVYDQRGRVFASYAKPSSRGVALPSSPGAVGARFERRQLVVVRPIVLDGETIGVVYVQSSLDELWSGVVVFGAATLVIVVGCGLIALVTSTGMQRRVLRPLLDLADTARQVTSDRNFALRAALSGHDEVGTLVEDFNRMLAEIEQQDRQVRQQQEHLEAEVAHRTSELVAANDRLVVSMRRVKSYADQIAQLTTLGQLLQSCDTTHEIYGVVQLAARKLFPADSGALSVLNSSRNLMEAMAVWGDAPPGDRVFGPEECWAYRLGRPHFVSDPQSPLRCLHVTPTEGAVTFCVPMVAQGDTLGVLHLEFRETDEPDEDGGTNPAQSAKGRLATALAEHVALALANQRLREELRNQSIIDPLTGLFNRRYLEKVLERECRRASRSGRPLALLMIDVDKFKRFNDLWGHEGGDAVLRGFAGVMQATFRGEDVACRYGGEEFVVLLADASLESAFSRAEDLRTAVHHLSVEHRKQPVGAITISLGVAVLPEHGSTPETLIESADRALYEAKARGRDRTVSASVSDLTPAVQEVD